MIKTKREMIVDIWKTNPFAIAWRNKLRKNKELTVEKKEAYTDEEKGECQHICSGNCRLVDCNCECGECGEWHCEDCHDTGIISKTEWSGTDDSYDVEVRCHCTED